MGRKKIEINVPQGIRYMSQWEDFEIPDHPHIMDKEIPGCGFTEYCLTNSEDTILCSPRKILLQNKKDQHKRDVFLVRTLLDKDINIDKDLQAGLPKNYTSKKLADLLVNPDDYKTSFEKVSTELEHYIVNRKTGKPIKILTTYDSFGLIKRALSQIGVDIKKFRVVIDEFQSIFVDSRFKATVELDFVRELQGIQKVCYLSATPMMEPYLTLPPFDTMDYYELNWEKLDPTRVRNPYLKVRVVNSIITKAKQIIQTYLDSNFVRVYLNDGTYKESEELVIYVNSVNNICQIIKKTGLKPEQVNILVSNTPENVKRIHRKLGRKYNIGAVPLRGEPRKMFTFCTRTVYLGADFYSDNARTVILSDANIQTLAVDISLDLPQILGRQRLEENPWKNEAEFYYIQLSIGNQNALNATDINKFIDKKKQATQDLINLYNIAPNDRTRNILVDRCNDLIDVNNYKKDYLGFSYINNEFVPAENKLVEIAERRGFDIQKIDYQDRFHVFSSIDSSVGVDYKTSDEIHNFFSGYTKIKKNIQDGLRYYCEREDKLSPIARDRIKDMFSAKFKSYLSLGKDRLKALSYVPADIEAELNRNTISIDDLIHSEFKEGTSMSKTEIKEKLQKIYESVEGYKKKAKASDLSEWFELGSGKVKNDLGKWVNGFKIIKRK